MKRPTITQEMILEAAKKVAANLDDADAKRHRLQRVVRPRHHQ